jgi:hypothetical protein
MRSGGGWVSVAVLSFVPYVASAQTASYTVKLTCTGYVGSMNFGAGEPGCPKEGDAGTEIFVGCLAGDEGELESEQEVFYYGQFSRTTEVWACDSKRLPDGTDALCATHIQGATQMTGELSIYSDRDGAYLSIEPEAGQPPAATEGSCDPELTAGLAADYPESTGGADIEDYPAGPLRVGRYGAGPDPADPYPPGTCVLDVLQKVARCP